MRRMEFTIEDKDAFQIGQEMGVTEGVLPSSYIIRWSICWE